MTIKHINNYREAIELLAKIDLDSFIQIRNGDVVEDYKLLETSPKLNYFTCVLVYNGRVKNLRIVINTKYLVGKELIY